MSETPMQVVQGMYDAFRAGDVPAVLGRMHEQIQWNEANNFPYADGNPYIGPEAVLNGVLARCIGLCMSGGSATARPRASSSTPTRCMSLG